MHPALLDPASKAAIQSKMISLMREEQTLQGYGLNTAMYRQVYQSMMLAVSAPNLSQKTSILLYLSHLSLTVYE